MWRWEKFNFKERIWHYGPFDVVFCRNVLIYFDQETKAQILGKMRDTLVPGGYLLLGATETTLGLDDTYDRKSVGRGIVYQKKSE